MELSNLKMPIKVAPYKHQKEAFKFICERFGLTKLELKNMGVVPMNISKGKAAALLMEMG